MIRTTAIATIGTGTECICAIPNKTMMEVRNSKEVPMQNSKYST
jgi:hypothetical protein